MEQLLQNIAGYITLYAPIVISVLGSIITIITSIKRVTSVKDEAITSNNELKRQMAQVLKENAELKEQLIQEKLDKHKIYTNNHKRG